MRFLGIDLGTRRVGLAFGDELGVATPLPALTQADESARWAALPSTGAWRAMPSKYSPRLTGPYVRSTAAGGATSGVAAGG